MSDDIINAPYSYSITGDLIEGHYDFDRPMDYTDLRDALSGLPSTSEIQERDTTWGQATEEEFPVEEKVIVMPNAPQ